MRNDLICAVEQLLYREARLLDERQFHEWLALFTDDLRYWMPVRTSRYPRRSRAIVILDEERYVESELAQEGELALLDETKQSLSMRIARLDTGMAWYLDNFFDRREGGIEVIGGMHRWVIPCNWKFPAENFGGDPYHVGWSHLSAVTAGFTPGGASRPGAGGQLVQPGNGHGIIALAPGNLADPAIPTITAYEEAIRPEVEQRLGPRFSRIFPIVGTLFPNFSFLRASARTFRVWHPRGPDKVEVWACIFVDKAAPPEVKEAYRLAGIRTFSPSGTLEQDDMENWQECTKTCQGVVSRRYPLNYQMGMGHERFDDDLGAWTSNSRYSELNPRRFYERWTQFMTTDSWAEVAHSPIPFPSGSRLG